jgi:hypothetical protein
LWGVNIESAAVTVFTSLSRHCGSGDYFVHLKTFYTRIVQAGLFWEMKRNMRHRLPLHSLNLICRKKPKLHYIKVHSLVIPLKSILENILLQLPSEINPPPNSYLRDKKSGNFYTRTGKMRL